jgi:hypothetical protein
MREVMGKGAGYILFQVMPERVRAIVPNLRRKLKGAFHYGSVAPIARNSAFGRIEHHRDRWIRKKGPVSREPSIEKGRRKSR